MTESAISRIIGPLMLAPLAGYTDKAFREIAESLGADGAVTEMVSAEGLARGGEKTEALLERYPGEKALVMQIFAPSDDPVARCMERLIAHAPSVIDINCGCPVPKVVKTGAGSALMREPGMIGRIVRTIKAATDTPVSVKFRLGWDSSSINYMDFAEEAASAGADMLTLHARTRAQGYSGNADRSAFRTLSGHFSGSGILIYGSGDVFTPEDAAEMIDGYGLDGVMFARGAIGNPFIFRMTKEYMQKGSYTLPSIGERIETAERHLSLAISYFGEHTACREMKKQLMAYLKGISGAAPAKAAIGRASTEEELRAALHTLL